MNTPIVSIIVPVYNTERYLHRCVDSILAQTFTEFELLLIDDGSTDQSGIICDEYVVTDFRVHAFHKQNGGVSSARNQGLEMARGKWITFIDSDDYVSETYLDDLLRPINDSNNLDLIIDFATWVFNDREEKETYVERNIEISDIKVLFIEDDLIWHTSPWGKLYKSEIINKYELRFPIGMHIGEDACYLFSYLTKCSKIRSICKCGYHYMIDRGNTLTKRVNNFDSELLGLANITNSISNLESILGDFINHGSFTWLKAVYQRRCLNALYKSNKSFKERYGFISTTDFCYYLNSLTEDSIQGKIYQFLLRKKCFILYDWLRSFISIIR